MARRKLSATRRDDRRKVVPFMSYPVTTWEPLLRGAILGTSRQPFNAQELATTAPEPLQAALSELASAAPEQGLLSAAALVTLYQHAGKEATDSNAILPPPCEPDSAPQCNAAAAARFLTLLEKPTSPLLAQWLRYASEVG